VLQFVPRFSTKYLFLWSWPIDVDSYQLDIINTTKSSSFIILLRSIVFIFLGNLFNEWSQCYQSEKPKNVVFLRPAKINLDGGMSSLYSSKQENRDLICKWVCISHAQKEKKDMINIVSRNWCQIFAERRIIGFQNILWSFLEHVFD